MLPSPDRARAAWRRASPRARRRTAAALALGCAWAVAVGIANLPPVRGRLLSAARDALSRRLPGASLGNHVAVDPLFRVHLGPLTVPASRRGAPPLLHAEALRVRPDPLSLLAGRPEPASVRIYGARIAPGERLSELRALADQLPSRAEPRAGGPASPSGPPRSWPAIHLRHATIQLVRAGRSLEVGPLDATLLRRRAEGRDEIEAGISHRRGGRAWAQLRRTGDGLRIRASVRDLGPSALPPPRTEGALRWSGGRISLDAWLEGAPDGPARGSVRGRLEEGWFSGDRLATEPVGPVSISVDGTAEVDPDAGRAALRDARLLLLGAVEARLSAEARLAPGLPFSLAFDLPGADFGALVEALPPPLRPPAEAPSPAGPLSFRVAVAGPLRDPSAWAVDAALDLSRLREAARRAPPVALRAPFTWRPEVQAGEPPAIRIGADGPDFVPLADVPAHVLRAVTTSEDAGFFAHPGFDFEELRNAFAEGAEAGRVVRGASTITQQLAKNLYLSRERTFARKAREAMVAVALEAAVPKARLLEIYLNLAEWGPGLWGIGPAARHYFGKAPRDLTLREAAFLASIIPNPVRYHGYFVRGELDEAWADRLRAILLHMAQSGAITEEQLLEALDAPLAFANGAGD